MQEQNPPVEQEQQEPTLADCKNRLSMLYFQCGKLNTKRRMLQIQLDEIDEDLSGLNKEIDFVMSMARQASIKEGKTLESVN